ncbi:MAG: hypothetical protein ACYC44_02025 [Patescibacteria group bacterium]
MKKINLVALVIVLFSLIGCDSTPKPGPMNYEKPMASVIDRNTKSEPMNYEKPTAPLSSASVAMTSTGSMRTGRTSGLVLGGRCDCAFEGQKIMTDDGPGFCFDGVVVKEEAYKKLSVDPKFGYTLCPDPRKPNSK